MPTNKLLTDEQEAFLLSILKGRGNQELADLVNQKFNLSLNRGQVNSWKKNRKLSSGLNGQFEKGHVPVNKGTKGLYNVGGNETSFKKGQRPLNYRPVGSERICSKEGYVMIKTEDGQPWKLKHNVIWEKANGPIPKGSVLIFADGNKLNVVLDNLILISRRQLLTMNQNGWIKNNKELTEVGVTLASIKVATIDKQKCLVKGKDMQIKGENTV